MGLPAETEIDGGLKRITLEDRKHLVGTNSTGYLAQRNYYSLPFKNYRFTKIWDKYRLLAEIGNRLGTAKPHYRTSHSEGLLRHLTPGVRHYHFLNTVSYSRKTPWMVTFETSLPRYFPDKARGVALLQQDSCRYIIAHSENAFGIQQAVFDHHCKTGLDDVMRKMMVLRTPQRKILDSIAEKELPGDYFHIALVGNDLLLKGCREAIAAVEHLVRKGHDIKLSVVGNLKPITYPYRSSPDMIQEVENGLKKGFVQYYPSLPNEQVIALFKRAHLALLPTFADTFGYVVLESQACGTPVVSTNIRSLVETNPINAGWQIETRKDRFGNMLLQSKTHVQQASAAITEGLIHSIVEAMDNPEMLKEKSVNCIRHIAENHSIERATETLEALYNGISS